MNKPETNSIMNKKGKPMYTKARHEVYNPEYIPKALQLHTQCKWKNKHHSNEECFFTAYASIQKYIPGSESNGQMPVGYFNMRLGNYNVFKVNLRDFVEFNNAIQQLAAWMDENKETMQEAMDAELTHYQDHQFRIFMAVTNANSKNIDDTL